MTEPFLIVCRATISHPQLLVDEHTIPHFDETSDLFRSGRQIRLTHDGREPARRDESTGDLGLFRQRESHGSYGAQSEPICAYMYVDLPKILAFFSGYASFHGLLAYVDITLTDVSTICMPSFSFHIYVLT